MFDILSILKYFPNKIYRDRKIKINNDFILQIPNFLRCNSPYERPIHRNTTLGGQQ